MKKVSLSLWKSEDGAIISAELVLVMTIAVLSMVVGLSSVAHALNAELEDVSEAFGALSQSYQYQGLSACTAAWSGSSFNDEPDTASCDCIPLRIRSDHFSVQDKCEGGSL